MVFPVSASVSDAALALLRQAVKGSGRQEFVRSCLVRLWPGAELVLREVSLRLGGEIRLPGDSRTLLSRSIRTGVAYFNRLHKPRSRHGYYRLDDWEQSVYLGFFTGLFMQAGEVGYCRVLSSDGGIWTVLGPPYMVWRERHPGPVQVEWGPGDSQARTAWRLAWQVMLAGRRRHWIERRLLEALGDVAGVQA